MIAFNAPVFTAVILAISGVNAYRTDYVTGHDFDFSVTYPSGLTFSTTERPTDVLSATDIGAKEPLVTLTDPDGTGRDDRYVAFVEISYIPTIDSINDVIYEFPWIESNLTVLSNGTLTPDVYDSGRITYFHTIWTNEVRNATLHVWKQTPELVDFLLDNSFAGTFWQLALVWSNTTSKISYDFPRSNIDFKIRNGTGEDRGGIDDNGASIVGCAGYDDGIRVGAGVNDWGCKSYRDSEWRVFVDGGLGCLVFGPSCSRHVMKYRGRLSKETLPNGVALLM
ncbi:hypothetical protein F4821DRAFT_276974 [Hypoxylon rubiginosum]|uniref:Uncharacterized protein n=1 Tax=Hypoxylon rubiginosum TaxID=110542 RepID=A0ACC0D7N6_9PEZI|nr:hypothetical protein F4821DRAFT_276974 [Hypoxylon rubiginosum]